jgi:polyisoprenoid-binding protein YceI
VPWGFDANHSSITWENQHLGISFIRGRFKSFQAEVEIDDSDLRRSSVTTTIDTTSIDSGNERRDDTLKGDIYLDVARYPTAEFRSTRIEKRGERYAIIGDLTLHGTTREVVLDAAFNGQTKNQRGGTIRGFSAQTAIRRSDFGVSTTLVEGIFMAADQVNLLIELELSFKE